jgi:4-hydroxybenzoate polyprenyltransferase
LLKYYFQLFRIPNIFTVPPDILAGYFVTTINNIVIINYYNILLLVFSSSFLYVGGLITNDLFDKKIDKIERPNRPVASGKIKVSTTIFLAILFFGSGIFLASLLTFTSTIISILLVIMILSYNSGLKNGLPRPFMMGGIRTLNIIYGSTSNYDFFKNLTFDIEPNFINAYSINLIILTSAIFIHIFTLTWLSKRETENENKQFNKSLDLKKIYNTYLFFFVVILVLGLIFLPNKYFYLEFFIAFLLSITTIFYNKIIKKKYGYLDIQFIVKNMIVLLILLDSSFVAGSHGLYIGLLSLSMLIPCLFIGRIIHMT